MDGWKYLSNSHIVHTFDGLFLDHMSDALSYFAYTWLI